MITQDMEQATAAPHFEQLQWAEWETFGHYAEWMRKQMIRKGKEMLNDPKSQPHERAIAQRYLETAAAIQNAKGVLTSEICRQYPDRSSFERRSIFQWW